MRARRDDDEDDGGLDSLLDTMTNVVGILVLVLIVTQMSVADVVSKITSENQIDAEDMEKLNQQLVQMKTEENDLEKILVDPLSIDADRQQEELAKKRELLERRKKLLEQKKKEKNQYAMKIVQDRKLADQNKKKIADTETKRKELQTLITSSLEKKAKLEAMLDKTPKTKAPADIEVSIPNPRPAPDGAKEFLVICTENRLYPVNIEYFRKAAQEKAKAIIVRFNLNRDPAKGIDPAKFKQYYERLKEQDDFFDVEHYVQGDRSPRIRLIPREGRGATDKELLNPRSRIRTKWLSAVDPTKYYARFQVLPDSYDVYVTARRFFGDSGMLAGWQPLPQSYVLTSWVPGGIELGPPREKPKPKTPAAPPKKANVID